MSQQIPKIENKEQFEKFVGIYKQLSEKAEAGELNEEELKLLDQLEQRLVEFQESQKKGDKPQQQQQQQKQQAPKQKQQQQQQKQQQQPQNKGQQKGGSRSMGGLKKSLMYFALGAIGFVIVLGVTNWLGSAVLSWVPRWVIVGLLIAGAIAAMPLLALVFKSLSEGNLGGVIILILASYFMLLTIEGYYLALSPAATPFLPKLFLDDGARISQIYTVTFWANPLLWMGVVFALAVQTIQSRFLRNLLAKNYQVGDMAQMATKKPVRAANAGFIILVSYLIDTFTAADNYPFWGGVDDPFVNAFYFFAAILAFEKLLDLGMSMVKRGETANA